MKFNQIMLFFGLTLPVSVVLRFLQISFTVETNTGFYISGFQNHGTLLLFSILLCSILMMIFARMTFKQKTNPPKYNIPLCISSLLLSVALGNEVFVQLTSPAILFWQALLIKLFGVISAVYFLVLAFSFALKFKIPDILSTIPTVYLIIRMICDFTSISKLALISDNVIIIAVYCFMLLFFLNYAKLYNKMDDEKNSKKLLSYGLSSVIMCFTNSIPNFVTHFTTPTGYSHTPMSTNISVLFFGIFIFTFVISHFKQKNEN